MAAVLEKSAETAAHAAVADLVVEMNKGRGNDTEFKVSLISTYTARANTGGEVTLVPHQSFEAEVSRKVKGDWQTIAGLAFHPDGTVRIALVKQGVAFSDVPRALRALTL